MSTTFEAEVNGISITIQIPERQLDELQTVVQSTTGVHYTEGEFRRCLESIMGQLASYLAGGLALPEYMELNLRVLRDSIGQDVQYMSKILYHLRNDPPSLN